MELAMNQIGRILENLSKNNYFSSDSLAEA